MRIVKFVNVGTLNVDTLERWQVGMGGIGLMQDKTKERISGWQGDPFAPLGVTRLASFLES